MYIYIYTYMCTYLPADWLSEWVWLVSVCIESQSGTWPQSGGSPYSLSTAEKNTFDLAQLISNPKHNTVLHSSSCRGNA